MSKSLIAALAAALALTACGVDGPPVPPSAKPEAPASRAQQALDPVGLR